MAVTNRRDVNQPSESRSVETERITPIPRSNMEAHQLCTCSLCGSGGERLTKTTYKRHQRDERLRHSSSGVAPTDPPPPPQAEAGISQGLENLEPPSLSTPNTIEYTINFLHARISAWRFPTSLVFAPPPTKDSPHFTLKTATELRVGGSSFRLSIRDRESSRVVGYECFLLDTLQLLEAYDLPGDDPMATQTAESIATILAILATLDTNKGVEWDRQVRAQKDLDTYLLTGVYARFLMFPVANKVSQTGSVRAPKKGSLRLSTHLSSSSSS